MSNRFVREGLARNAARRHAAEVLADTELAAEAFADAELTAEERLVAHAELRRLAAEIRSTLADRGQ